MEYTFIGYGVNAGSFTGKDGKNIQYCTNVVVVQGTDKERGFKQVKEFKLGKGFNAVEIKRGALLSITFDEFGKVTAIYAR